MPTVDIQTHPLVAPNHRPRDPPLRVADAQPHADSERELPPHPDSLEPVREKYYQEDAKQPATNRRKNPPADEDTGTRTRLHTILPIRK